MKNGLIIGKFGDKRWYKDDKYHREDGPAIEGNKQVPDRWYLEGKKIDCTTQQEFEQLMKLKAFW